jgi:hypothetical protein
LPGGDRNYNGTFSDVGNFGFWWTSTEGDGGIAWCRGLHFLDPGVNRDYGYGKVGGFYVRCLRDN